MPHELRFRPEALADLEDIARAVRRASGSAQVGRRYIARVLERCRRIATLPHAGGPREDLAPGLRSVPFERRLVIVYGIILEPDAVEITNVTMPPSTARGTKRTAESREGATARRGGGKAVEKFHQA